MNDFVVGYELRTSEDRYRDLAEQVIDGLEMLSRGNAPPYFVALAYVGLGENDETLKWLEGALQERSGPKGSPMSLYSIPRPGSYNRSTRLRAPVFRPLSRR